MNYEVNDFRKPKPPIVEGFPFWIVPKGLVFDYVFKLLIFIIVIPFLFGVILQPLGLFFNFILVDYFIYQQYRNIVQ